MACPYADPGTSIAPFVHQVVNQADMATYRDTLAGSLQVGFGCDSILIIAEIIANIRQYFYQGNAYVRYMTLLPVWHDEGQSIQDELPETCVVFGKIVDFRLNNRFRWAGFSKRA